MSWPLVKLSDVATVNPRCPKDIDGSQDVSFLAMASVSEDGCLLHQESRVLEETKKGFTYFERNDVIVAKITPCFENGKAAYLDKLNTRVGFGSTEFHVIRPDTEKLDGKYLFYLLWNPKFRHLGVRNMSGSAGQKRVPTDFLKNHEIPLPPLPEQKRIAAILDKADQLRQKRQQAIGLADEFLRSVFLDMFGDPVTNPKGWEVKPLREMLEFVTSGSRGWAKYYSDSGARFIRSLDVQTNSIGSNDVAFVTPPESAESNRTRVADGDVLLTITGSKIGRVCYIPEGFGEAYISQHVAILRLKDQLRPKFMSMFMNLKRGGQLQINNLQYGQTKPGLNLDQIRRFKIPLPSLDLQDQYLALWERVDVLQNSVLDSTESARCLFNSLSQKAFAGEL